MATQRITIAKVVGIAADSILARLREWSEARLTINDYEWSSDQWPAAIQIQAIQFADQLRAESFTPPVIHFVEWIDMWSMFNVFSQWLTPPNGPVPIRVCADAYEIYGYRLPDGGKLARHLADAGTQQFKESQWFISRLAEAVEAWSRLPGTSVIVVLRQILEGTVLDEDVEKSLRDDHFE